MRRLKALMKKEFLHMMRDPRTLVTIFIMPILQLALLGFAGGTDIRNIPTVIFDQDQSQASRSLLDAFKVTGYFSYDFVAYRQDDINQLIESGRAKIGIIIPASFHDDLAAGRTSQVAVLVDGSDPTIATSVLSVATFVGQSHGASILAQKLAQRGLSGASSTSSPVDVRTRVLYNPDLLNSFNIVPGLIGIILMQTTTTLTSLAIVKEREVGTIEQLIVTPIRNWELILAKITPYILVAIANTIVVMFIGSLMFQVPIRGNLLLLLLLTGLYILPNLGIGLLISTFAHTQREAQFMTMPIMLPSMMLSGFIFPIASMPVFLQLVGKLLPLTYFLLILRGVVIKGVGVQALYPQIAALVVLAIVLLTAAALRFRKTIE
jgi:ABC-2 type transport system permease protein